MFLSSGCISLLEKKSSEIYRSLSSSLSPKWVKNASSRSRFRSEFLTFLRKRFFVKSIWKRENMEWYEGGRTGTFFKIILFDECIHYYFDSFFPQQNKIEELEEEVRGLSPRRRRKHRTRQSGRMPNREIKVQYV